MIFCKMYIYDIWGLTRYIIHCNRHSIPMVFFYDFWCFAFHPDYMGFVLKTYNCLKVLWKPNFWDKFHFQMNHLTWMGYTRSICLYTQFSKIFSFFSLGVEEIFILLNLDCPLWNHPFLNKFCDADTKTFFVFFPLLKWKN